MRVAAALPLLLALAAGPGADAFVPPAAPSSSSWSSSLSSTPPRRGAFAAPSMTASASASADSAAASSSASSLSSSVADLKKVLEREYVTFFDPMRTEYYAPSVSFVDPMTTLEGVDSYRNNVDMLASRTPLGKLLFEDAGIVLHGVDGGDISVSEDGTETEIADIVTRWTLRMTVKALPWSPTARFTGISVYKVAPASDSEVGVQIAGQIDYWDSVNILPNSSGQYAQVDKSKAVADFLGQLSPGGFTAAAAAPELPYQLLRRGDGYEVRRYPAYAGVKLPYNRRDEGFGSLGAFTKGMDPLSPALMEVEAPSSLADKYMTWPLTFAPPGSSAADPVAAPSLAEEKAGQGQWRTIRTTSVPSKVVAVREFNDASMEPVVRRADRELRECLERDGLRPAGGSGEEGKVKFAQYDAVFSMGKRRGEVWIDLCDEEGGHPW